MANEDNGVGRPDGPTADPLSRDQHRIPLTSGESDRFPALELEDERVVIYDRETLTAWIMADNAVPLPDVSPSDDH